MKSVGTLIRDVRTAKRISRKKLERDIKIKNNFVEFLEEGNWEHLPEYPITAGFVKNIAQYLGIDEKKVLALLRRDFPQKALRINPKPEISDRVIWGPRTALFLGTTVLLLSIVGYLSFQYINFVRPPSLSVNVPTENQEVRGMVVIVEGNVDSEATLTVNNQPVLVEDMGNFSSEIPIYEGTREIVFVAKSRSGKETRVVRKINPVL